MGMAELIDMNFLFHIWDTLVLVALSILSSFRFFSQFVVELHIYCFRSQIRNAYAHSFFLSFPFFFSLFIFGFDQMTIISLNAAMYTYYTLPTLISYEFRQRFRWQTFSPSVLSSAVVWFGSVFFFPVIIFAAGTSLSYCTYRPEKAYVQAPLQNDVLFCCSYTRYLYEHKLVYRACIYDSVNRFLH